MEGETIGIIAGSIGAVAMAVAGVFAKTRKNGSAVRTAQPTKPAEPPPTKSEVAVLRTRVDHVEEQIKQFREDNGERFNRVDKNLLLLLERTAPPRPAE